MLKNLIEKMTWPRAALLAVMVAVVAGLTVVDAHLAYARFAHRPTPASFVGVVEIPADPAAVEEAWTPITTDDSVAGALLAGDTFGDEDDGILNLDSSPQ